MNNKNLFFWPEYANKTFDDGKFIDEYIEPYTFPGYIKNINFPLFPLNTLTHFIPKTTIKDIGYCMGDGPEAYLSNKEKKGPSWHYYDKKIEYVTNKNGYRAPEWETIDWKNSVVLLGCSMIFGVGVAEDETISYYLSKMIGKPVINLGFPAGSNEIIFNNSVSIFENFGIPSAVITFWSTMDRFQFYASYPHCVGLWTQPEDTATDVNLFELYNSLNGNDVNQNIKSYFLEVANRNFWKDRTEYYSASFFSPTSHYMRLDNFFKPDNNARDLIHPGKDKNYEVAQKLYTILKNKGI